MPHQTVTLKIYRHSHIYNKLKRMKKKCNKEHSAWKTKNPKKSLHKVAEGIDAGLKM